MDLFNEIKNKYFQKVLCIVNEMTKGKRYTDKDIRDALRQSFNEPDFDFEDALLGKLKSDNNYGEINLLKKEGDNYIPTLKMPLPIRPTKLELEWLKTIVKDSNATFILNEELIYKLEKNLANVNSAYEERFWIRKNVDNTSCPEHSPEIREFLELIRKAIIDSRFIKYKSVNKRGVSYEKEGYPYRIKYSPKNNSYKLSLFSVEENRAIKINLSSFKSIEIIDRNDSGVEEKAISFIESKKNMEEPIVMEIADKVNAVERCFSLFSHYHREAYFDRDKDKHIMKLYYYKFDEAEIIKDVLSLGSFVSVISPGSIRDIVIKRIKAALYGE